MILPLVPPRPIAIIGGAEDGFAPATSLQRLARAAQDWPEVTLRVYPAVGHFITESQAQEVSDWIAGQAHLLP
jgi:pimeloyl-ACP methyl ester carboxylesterase